MLTLCYSCPQTVVLRPLPCACLQNAAGNHSSREQYGRSKKNISSEHCPWSRDPCDRCPWLWSSNLYSCLCHPYSSCPCSHPSPFLPLPLLLPFMRASTSMGEDPVVARAYTTSITSSCTVARVVSRLLCSTKWLLKDSSVMFFRTQPTFTSSSMAFDVPRSRIETFASKTSNEFVSDMKGCERISIIEPSARTRERGSYSTTGRR